MPVRKSKDKDHALTIAENGALGGELILVKGGKRAYVWACADKTVLCVSGPATLRKLAYAILKEVGK